MFISSSEKEKIHEGITLLCAEVAKLKTEIIFLTAKIKASEGAKATPKKQPTEAQKKAQREYMRKYTARKRAEKLAQATA
jgi:hypothetical protein